MGRTVPSLASLAFAALSATAARADAPAPHVIPYPADVRPVACRAPLRLHAPLSVAGALDRGGLEIIAERWKALGIPLPSQHAGGATLVSIRGDTGGDAYRLRVADGRISIRAANAGGEFLALTTLAQLPQRDGAGWYLPCVAIADRPALRWRILSDDVSRGPLPTMTYFKERIRTIAAFKMNGYSPYMEHVFADPKHPLPAPLDGITPPELRELDAYARRFHVTFIPEQQTFAHMHNTLRWERYAAQAELPHGYLMSPQNPQTYAYLRDLLHDELAIVPHPTFFHLGADEPSDLGRGQTKELVEREGDARVYADHVLRAIDLIAGSGARPMIWDDAIQRHPEILARFPKSLVVINWHYGNEKTFAPYIARIAGGGFDQMVAPGANNWNEIYPDLEVALPNEARFIAEGQQAGVFGLFQTVWHDDGESLYEATWYPVLYAAAAAWQRGPIDTERFARDFPAAFFGVDDPRLKDDVAALGRIRSLLRTPRDEDSGDYLFWSDPFDARLRERVARDVNLIEVRQTAENVIAHLLTAPPPPLHPNAARVIALAARRYDALARNFQIAADARYYYDDARANADGKHENLVYRGLFIAKYLLWEMRDSMLEIEPLYRAAWNYESRPGHLASVLERYHLAARRAIERADRINASTFEGYLRARSLPAFDEALGLAPGARP